MKTTEPAGVTAAGKLVLAFVAFGLLMLFVGSFVSRIERPSLVVRQEPAKPSGEAMMSGPMKEIMELMAKVKEHPDDPDLQIEMGERFMSMGAWEKAKTFLEKAEAKRPDDPALLNDLGVTLYNLKDPAGAKAKFERMVALDPKDYRARFNLGLLLKSAFNQPDQAAEQFKAVLSLPDVDAKTKADAARELEGASKP